jgi:hypothetical protein
MSLSLAALSGLSLIITTADGHVNFEIESFGRDTTDGTENGTNEGEHHFSGRCSRLRFLSLGAASTPIITLTDEGGRARLRVIESSASRSSGSTSKAGTRRIPQSKTNRQGSRECYTSLPSLDSHITLQRQTDHDEVLDKCGGNDAL